jgi:hypothetical protein
MSEFRGWAAWDLRNDDMGSRVVGTVTGTLEDVDNTEGMSWWCHGDCRKRSISHRVDGGGGDDDTEETGELR